MLIVKKISYETYLSLVCIFLCGLSLLSSVTGNYLLTYAAFLFSFVLLTIGFFILNKVYLFKLLFFFIPLSLSVDILDGAQIQLPTEPMIGMLTLFFIGFYRKLKSEIAALFRNPIGLLIGIELAWMIICSMTSEMKTVSFKYTFVRFCYIITFFVLGILWMKKEKKPHLFYLLYAIGIIYPIINGMLFHAQFGFIQKTAYLMPQPFFYDHTVYGACIAFIIIPVFSFVKNKHLFFPHPFHQLLLLLLLCFLLVAEYFSFSRAAWLSLAGALGMYILLKLRISGKLFIGVLGIVACIVFLGMNQLTTTLKQNKAISNKEDLGQQVKSIANVQTDVSNKERVNRWKCAIRMGQSRPIVGYGPRTYKFIYGSFQSREDMTYTSTFNGNKGHSHSDYLGYWAETGYPGFIIHIVLYIVILYQGINLIQKCKNRRNYVLAMVALIGLFTYFVHGIFNGFMEDEKMASLVFMSMGMLVFIQQEEDSTPNEAPVITN